MWKISSLDWEMCTEDEQNNQNIGWLHNNEPETDFWTAYNFFPIKIQLNGMEYVDIQINTLEKMPFPFIKKFEICFVNISRN